jgi:hypothetical protein
MVGWKVQSTAAHSVKVWVAELAKVLVVKLAAVTVPEKVVTMEKH